MKLLTSIITAVATLAAAGAASASIPGDGGYTDGLRVVYATPITARSVVVHERYYLCRAAEPACALARRGPDDTRDGGEVVPLHAEDPAGSRPRPARTSDGRRGASCPSRSATGRRSEPQRPRRRDRRASDGDRSALARLRSRSGFAAALPRAGGPLCRPGVFFPQRSHERSKTKERDSEALDFHPRGRRSARIVAPRPSPPALRSPPIPPAAPLTR